MSRIEYEKLTWPELVSGYQATLATIESTRRELDTATEKNDDAQRTTLLARRMVYANDVTEFEEEILERVRTASPYRWQLKEVG